MPLGWHEELRQLSSLKKDVAVGVQCEARRAMPEALRDYLDMLVGRQKERSVAVPQVVKPDLWQLGLLKYWPEVAVSEIRD